MTGDPKGTCEARIRPMPDDTEVRCEESGEHNPHAGVIRDYAYPGSRTVIRWFEPDRRTFHGEWPGHCTGACILPRGHKGRHSA